MTTANEPITGIEGVCDGLTKREYFAAMAMQGLAIQPGYTSDIAARAVAFADHLIIALNKPDAL